MGQHAHDPSTYSLHNSSCGGSVWFSSLYMCAFNLRKTQSSSDCFVLQCTDASCCKTAHIQKFAFRLLFYFNFLFSSETLILVSVQFL